ncbi:N-acetylmuramic acid 6-phosphate etherase [Hydrogenoanaerobacterium saccharovorans]|uniref:N-acetylmuramic acid 6-phosphate etherase n=1 Tax=Hydrogenoanaerobacterium saccharovorans TaxID=474960 RepID=A0A1H8EC06_9FIRM|nr:N-acetylmuramic acid 6-phosphate etherase [Hydrogenoanaerobacterium saccharovorans]RPF42033.1 N-acetylmuramic acid 6-phosphate etherase [Hydrogenoanaerobacterium saccharovorans]SEN17101.1 N-acetylmuramic acid 6-phosphate etherase [Hydrogenoanaerobacterium saccharovorans]
MLELTNIQTEQRNERTAKIDQVSTLEMVRMINKEDKVVADAVELVLPQIARAVDVIYEKLAAGGRLFYCGCGTSGRLGVLDAAECPPTFGTDPELVQALMAGGTAAFTKAIEGAEDDYVMGGEDLKKAGFTAADVLVGIAASGRTPYVIGAMEYAKKLGAKVIGLTCCPASQIDELADIGISPMPGPEAITGSTRMKSGTAQKMVLNMLSTGVMIKLGKVYGNLMVDVKATNEKLVERAVSIVRTATGTDNITARRALSQCGFSAKNAILMLLCGVDAEQAKILLDGNGGRIADAVKTKQGQEAE